MKTYKLISYDVWGNAEDGYEVNDIREVAQIELDPKDTELGADPVTAFIERGDLAPDIRATHKFDDLGYGDGLWLEIETKDDAMPVGRIEEVVL